MNISPLRLCLTRVVSLCAAALFTALLPAGAAPPGKTQQLTSPDQVPDGLAKSDWQSIRAAYEAGRHAFQPTASGWQARNPGQQWLTTFDQRGFVAQPKDGDWQWGLELQSYGFGENQHTISGQPVVKADGQRLTYQWDSHVQEWFVNDQRGLEHGFIVAQRPATRSAEHRSASSEVDAPKAEQSSALLSFTLATRGGLRPHVAADALGVDFRDAAGATVLTYAGLKVWDADGKMLPSRFETVDGGARHSVRAFGEEQDVTSSSRSAENCPPALRLLVDERGARYPLTIDPVAQQAYVKASNTGVGDSFGWSVAVSGDTVVVAAAYEDSTATGVNAPLTGGIGTQADNSASGSGAAYVFVRSGPTWTQQAYLKASNTGVGDSFGYSVAVSGDTVVVGSLGEDSNATGVDAPLTGGTGTQADNAATDAGAAYVFKRSGTTWTQQAYLKASNTGVDDRFGYSVAVAGDTVVVGAYGEASNATGVNGNQTDNSATFSGAAYVFTRSGTTWTQQAYLKASNTGVGDVFGRSVAVAGDTVVVGAWSDDSNATGVNAPLTGGTGTQADNSAGNSGAAYVFVRSGTTWTQQAYLKANNTGADDQFGYSVAVSGDTVVVGALYEDSNATGVNGNQTDNSASFSGAAYAFTRTGTTWTQQAYLKASNTGADDRFGYSVAVSGDTVVVGASGEDSNATDVNGNQTENSASFSGAAYVFTRSGTTWTQQAYLKASNTGANDYFGYSVAVSGDAVVVAAAYEASNATGVNGNQADNSVVTSGAAYIFTGFGVVPSPMIDPQSLTVLGNGAFQFTFPNADNTAFTVLAASDLDLPLANWTDLGNATSIGGGMYQFTDPAATGFIRRYYQLRFP